jgi:hypothetical protein
MTLQNNHNYMHHLLLTSDEQQFCLQTALIGFLQQAVQFLKQYRNPHVLLKFVHV